MTDRFPDMPERMRALAVDERGFPVPWFVAWQDGKPVFPAMDPEKLRRAIRYGYCWVCGDLLGRYKTYVVGPMCIINRVSSEPPSHADCARFAAVNCPFLANPRMKRVPSAKYGGSTEHVAGIMLERNPGATACVHIFGDIHSRRDGPGYLFAIKNITGVDWYAKGRTATRAEVQASIDSGYPLLRELAEKDGPGGLAYLAQCVKGAQMLLPPS